MKTMQRINFLVVLVALATNTALAKVYDVLDYGAKGNGVDENAEHPEGHRCRGPAAEASCSFPPGEYRTATIFLKDNVTLRLAKGATIKGTPDYSLYPADIEPVYETFLLRKDRYATRVLIVALGKGECGD